MPGVRKPSGQNTPRTIKCAPSSGRVPAGVSLRRRRDIHYSEVERAVAPRFFTTRHFIAPALQFYCGLGFVRT